MLSRQWECAALLPRGSVPCCWRMNHTCDRSSFLLLLRMRMGIHIISMIPLQCFSFPETRSCHCEDIIGCGEAGIGCGERVLEWKSKRCALQIWLYGVTDQSGLCVFMAIFE